MKCQKLFIWSCWMTVIIRFSLKGRQSFIVLFLSHLRWNFTPVLFSTGSFGLVRPSIMLATPMRPYFFQEFFFQKIPLNGYWSFSNWSREQNIFLQTRGFFLSGLFIVGNSLISISLVFYIMISVGPEQISFWRAHFSS